MAKLPHQLLAQSLQRAKEKSHKGIVHANSLSLLDRKRLENDGWLVRIIRNWYILTQPTVSKGESTLWCSSFWHFLAAYLPDRFGKQYCLSANASLDLHLGKTTIPKQVLVMVKTGGSTLLNLPFDTSLLMYHETKTFPERVEQINGINVMPLTVALQRISPNTYQQHPADIEIALKMVEINALSRELLKGTNIASAERIIGAYIFLNEKERADHLLTVLQSAGFQVNPVNPFINHEPFLKNLSRIQSPYAARITALWQQMRNDILKIAPKEPGKNKIIKTYFSRLEKIYVNDAYNSLSIEGYDVSIELITKIANGDWNPEQSSQDKNQMNAMAAKGYRLAFEAVKESIERVFKQQNAGRIIKSDLHKWFAALFSPSVKAGLLNTEQLAGYRTHQVYIRGSMHTPLPPHALIDAMDAFFNCLISESSAIVRAILGHFIFVFIHPYMDGNGRIARFMMNSLLASGGFSWVIIPVAKRDIYFKALEKASAEQDIKPFAKFVLGELKHSDSLKKARALVKKHTKGKDLVTKLKQMRKEDSSNE